MGLFGSDPAVVRRLAAIERKLDAILASLGIEAPVEQMAPALAGLTPDALAEVRGLAQSGKKIEAIKRLRVLTGLGLKDAKDLVDAGL